VRIHGMSATTVEGVRGIAVLEPRADRMERLASWFASEQAGLLRFAFFVCGDRAEAEDLVQEAFIRTYRSAARLDDPRFLAYARTTIVNLSRSNWRRRSPAVELESVHTDPDPGERDEVWRALLQLSPRQRACMALRFYDGLRDAEIAAALGMGEGSVRKHTGRAMARLREILGSDAS
jgi:RNA polymerase sigma factor (sigma-70 family)